jgi:hypothetical protein
MKVEASAANGDWPEPAMHGCAAGLARELRELIHFGKKLAL